MMMNVWRYCVMILTRIHQKITANTTKITEIDKTVTDISKNQIFVVCDGDHDELKNTGGVVESHTRHGSIYHG